jgi:hypothetical protein
MKSAFVFLTTVVVVVGLSGCCHTGGFLSPHGHCLIDGSCGHCSDCPETCRSCDMEDCAACNGGAPCDGGAACDGGCAPPCGEGCGLLDRLCAHRYFNPGPPTGAVTYPYYTVRGPRDYFMKSPTPLGP